MASTLKGIPSRRSMNRLIVLQDVGSCSIRSAINGTRIYIHAGLLNEVLLLVLRQLMPIPPRDNIVEQIGGTLVIDLHTVGTNLVVSCLVSIIGIEAGLYVEQLQLTIRACRDGQWYLYLLRISCSRTSVCRYNLVVDIHLTLDIPVMSR